MLAASLVRRIAPYAVIGAAYLWIRTYYLAGSYWQEDQLAVGNLAHALIHGSVIPFWANSWPVYQHGSIILTPLIYLGFRLFGEQVVVMSAIAVLLSLGTCLIWIYLADRYESRRLAWLIGIAFVLATPFWNYVSVKLWAIHAESCFFAALQFAFLISIVRQESGWKKPAALGVLAGLSLVFALHNVFVIGTTVLFWLLAVGLTASWKRITIYLGATLTAYFPAIVYQWISGQNYEYFVRHTVRPPEEGVVGWLGERFVFKAKELFIDYLPNTPNFSSDWQNHLYLALVLLSWTILGFSVLRTLAKGRSRHDRAMMQEWIASRPVTFLCFLFPFVYLLLYTFGPMRIPEASNFYFYRYAMPLFPFYFILLALLFARLGRPAVILLAVFLVALGGREIIPFRDLVRPVKAVAGDSEILTVKGFDLWQLYFTNVPYWLASHPADRRIEAFSEVLGKLKGPERNLLCASGGRIFVENKTGLVGERERIVGSDRLCASYLDLGAGYKIGFGIGKNDIALPDPVALIENVSARRSANDLQETSFDAISWSRGLGWGLMAAIKHSDEVRSVAEQAGESPASGKPQDLCPESLASLQRIFGHLPAELRGAFVFGLGIEIGVLPQSNGYLVPAASHEAVLRCLCEDPGDELLSEFRLGFGYGLGLYLYRMHHTVPRSLKEEMMARLKEARPLVESGMSEFGREWRQDWIVP